MRTHVIHRIASFLAAAFVAALTMMSANSSAQTNAKAPQEIHMCSLLTPQDVLPIVGARPLSQETKGGMTCMWGDPGSDPNKYRLLIQAASFTQSATDPLAGVGTPASERMESSFKANRKQAFDDKSAHAKDEPQLGKNAFSALTDDGVEIIVMKKTSLLNIHYMTGKRGTPENVDEIRKVAAKVAASF